MGWRQIIPSPKPIWSFSEVLTRIGKFFLTLKG